MLKLTDTQTRIMAEAGHMLVTGGPGSGKTTVSIVKAADVAEHRLRPGQQVLFLSFARATVSRVIEAIEHEHYIPPEHKKRIMIETYHAFFWRILKTHGYLIGLPRRLSILTPQDEAIALSAIRSVYDVQSRLSRSEKDEKRLRETEEQQRLAFEEGQVCFDLFAHFAEKILHGSTRIRMLVSTMYPFVILDEFQDTNPDQWHVVRAIGMNSTIMALADPEQRIYDWIGADPERLDHFREEFNPGEIELGADNHRNRGTDIRLFGDHILKGRLRDANYNGVYRLLYEANRNQALAKLVTSTLQVRKRLIQSGRSDWSLAILVPTKRMTRIVSDSLRSPPAGLPVIPHTAAIEMEGAILGTEIIAVLMQPRLNPDHLSHLIRLLCNFFRGKGGDSPSKKDLEEAERIQRAYREYHCRSAKQETIRRNSILHAILQVYDESGSIAFSGNPEADWRAIWSLLDQGPCPRLNAVANEVENVRLLNRGTQLRTMLSQDWRDNKTYRNALDIVRQIFMQEHLLMAHHSETDVVVMNMYQAKGKQFDRVIIFDGWPQIVRGEIVSNVDRIVRSNSLNNDTEQVRQNFRVSVTRGRLGTTILTPKQDPCVLLRAHNE